MTPPLYHSDLGIFEFQAKGVGEAYVDPNPLAVWDTGIGKTHLAMILACVMFEDDLIDQVLVVAEVNKVSDWVADFLRFTQLEASKYHGPRRARLLDDPPKVLVGSYETIKNDAAKPGVTKRSAWKSGPLTEFLVGRRVLVIYDEVTKLKERSTGLYKAHDHMVGRLRKANAKTKVLGLTGTPVERGPDQAFNFGRIVKGTAAMGTIDNFERCHVVSYDLFGKPSRFKNIGPEDHRDPEVPTLKQRLAPMVKRKTDPDVVDQFPSQIEEFEIVRMSPVQSDFYETVANWITEDEIQALIDEVGEDEAERRIQMRERKLFTVLRMIAGYPLGLSRAEGQLAQELTERVGVEGLRAMGSPKRDRLIQDLIPIIHGQGAKVIVFTWFANTILPLLTDDLRNAGFEVVLNTGSMSMSARDRSIEEFRRGRASIFLSSDAGAKGLNLPEALYVTNFELPVTIANYIQRTNRNNRIDSKHPSVTCRSYIVKDTVEEGLRSLMLARNEWHDAFVSDGDEGEAFLSASDRRRLIRQAYRSIQ